MIPHLAYARSDKKDAPRISIAARLVADLLATAGPDRVLAMALHSPQVPGFFGVPVDHLHALFELDAHFWDVALGDAVVVAPDLGYVKEAARSPGSSACRWRRPRWAAGWPIPGSCRIRKSTT